MTTCGTCAPIRGPGRCSACSLITHCAPIGGVGLAAEKFGAQFFGDGPTPPGVLASDQRLGRDQLDQFSAIWHAYFMETMIKILRGAPGLLLQRRHTTSMSARVRAASAGDPRPALQRVARRGRGRMKAGPKAAPTGRPLPLESLSSGGGERV